jgi:hypothetical protein
LTGLPGETTSEEDEVMAVYEFEGDTPFIDATPFATERNLADLAKGTMRVPGVWSGPKVGDRITVDMGNGKMIDHIATQVTRDGYGGFSIKSRRATPADGRRTREQRKMVRAMRKSRRRRKVRAWVDRMLRRAH